MEHLVPDPPTQDGCIGCDDLHHGFAIRDRVVVVAPMTRRMRGVITGFALDKSDVLVDGRTIPLTVHTKWLEREAVARQVCRSCDCTNERACEGGCYWVEVDLCSRCRPRKDH